MNNNINKSAVQPIYFAILISIGFLLGTYNNSLKTNNQYYKILEVINAVNQEYVDTVKTDKLVELAINGLLQGLDPHSYYINSEDFTESNDLLQGSFDGIGIQFRLEKDTIIVINTINGGPSEKVGLKAGDRIVKINGETVAGVKIKENEVIHKLKGPRGTKVQISVFRKNVKSLIDFTITRDAIPVYSIDVAYMILNDIGYIRISRFSATTKDELIKELLSLKNKGMKKLILDLRGNGGGYMDAAIDISNEFLFKGNTIVFTKGRNRKPEYFFANGKGHFQQGSLIVLIDELSASASEIVAGAIQDNDRGILIGRRSFGKGLVQSQMTFKDGSAIRLTIARYYTPSGRCIQRPYKDGTQNYYNDFYTHLLNNDIDTLKNDSLKYKTIKGRTVYGGGGIMPDIVIPYEKDSLLYWFNEVNNLGLIYQFAFNLTDKYRDKLSKIKTIEELNKLFIIDDNIYKEFTLFASKNGAKLNKLDNIISKNKICNLLKAYIARNILGEQAFYILLNQNDNIVQIALKILQNEKLK